MMTLCCKVLQVLEGKTLSTAESCTGGMIGQLLTAVSGASAVYKGGVISYCNEVKENALGVSGQVLAEKGAVSAPVAQAMAAGVRRLMDTDVAVSVTGLAGPGGDEFGNPVGTVFIGYADRDMVISQQFLFAGSREEVRLQAAQEALKLICEHNS